MAYTLLHLSNGVTLTGLPLEANTDPFFAVTTVPGNYLGLH